MPTPTRNVVASVILAVIAALTVFYLNMWGDTSESSATVNAAVETTNVTDAAASVPIVLEVVQPTPTTEAPPVVDEATTTQENTAADPQQ